MKTKFKGFDRISNLEYKQEIFQCDKCQNSCDVTAIETEGDMLYYGDRCERYSGLHKEKTKLPNFFEEREKILLSYHKKGKGERIGLARTGLFNDLFPFFSTFLGELGFDVVLSRKTDKEIINKGIKKATTEFCFPFKVAFGHYHDLADKVNCILVPDIIETYRTKFSSNSNGEVKDTGWERSYTCPYIQNFNSLITKYLDNVKIINPYISFREGDLEKEFSAVMGFSKREVKRAISLGKEAYFDFKAKIRKKGQEVLSNGDRGIVVLGRPYSVYDEGVNLRIAKKILDLGWLAIPQDFLPYPGEDLSSRWPNEFATQGQLLLGAAAVIKGRNLEAVFLDYFGCGPNSFIKGFFAQELDEKSRPYLTLQIDEHTADAGVITRLEAFLDSLDGKNKK